MDSISVNETSFPYREYERNCEGYITTISSDYSEALKYIENHLKQLGYLTAPAVGIIDKRNNISVIANIVGRNILTGEELAGLFTFPKRQQTSTKRIIFRIQKMLPYWKSVVLFLCYKKGRGKFPVISRRIFNEPFEKPGKEYFVKLFSLNLNNGQIIQIRRKEESDQTKPKQKEMET